ncbi:hypothetical protein OB955_12340 [Halobacteria archaeon AArc-m2/3/4]|uniref:Uncharacterized protein n=1 Tax=Natronoglomus mannanivorans TaxID=2979990 RepID=A0AAP2YZI1_9EURY|nr:hypothetical protein [Halobacteria archaeon AArc-xg1-1]MCU4973526.1 hypothetical protein [Halobacteria archaeon AArc-m2/3/4]
MTRRQMLGNRLLHMIVLTIFVAIAIFEPIQAAIPRWEFVLASGFIVAWMLGQRYERMIVISAGLADPHELRDAERESSTWFPWNSPKQ